MSTVVLEKRQPSENVMRFYRITVTPTLFSSWAVVREWGRIGRDGQVRTLWLDSEDEARAAAASFRRQKERRGYIPLPAVIKSHPHH